MSAKPVIAIFDFDGTLTKSDTFLPFLFHCFGKLRVILGLIYTLPYTLGYILNLISNHIAKEKIVCYFFKNEQAESIENYARSFVDEKVDNNLRKNIINRLQWHQNKNHLTVLISASLEVYIKIWAKKYDFDHCESTKLQKNKDRYSGKIFGKNCYGEEKVKRLNKIFGRKLSDYQLYGYGDSKGDQNFLDLCNIKFSKSELIKI